MTWGVDFNTRETIIANDWGQYEAASHKTLGDTYRSVYKHAIALLIRGPAPGLVWVEQPSGRVHPRMRYTAGAIAAALEMAVTGQGSSAAVEFVPPSKWRRLVGLPTYGDVKEAALEMTKREFPGFVPPSHDVADALCIAVAANTEDTGRKPNG